MIFGKLTDTQYLLRFERGEEILLVLKNFCVEQNIKNASVSGIGSVENPILAHYRVDSKKYSEKEHEGIFEMTGLQGNVALLKNIPLPHLHVTLGDESMNAFAGHLVKGTVSATLEVIITVYPTEFTKQHDEIGLNLYNLPEQFEK